MNAQFWRFRLREGPRPAATPTGGARDTCGMLGPVSPDLDDRSRARQRTAFVLSGGGSLGAVQVGMLQALAAADIQPDFLIGTSAGGINATWVGAHGMSRESLDGLTDVWTGLRRRDVFPIRPLQILAGLTGRSRSLFSGEQLGDLVAEKAGIEDLSEATIPVHLLTTDLLVGVDVLLSSGSVRDAARATAAIPGVLPPVQIDDRWLVDGAIATRAGVSHAIGLGATRVVVLPAGVPCAIDSPPRSAIGVAVHALSLLIEKQLIIEVAMKVDGVSIGLLPPLCPLTVSPADFRHAAELIERGRIDSTAWIADGGLQRVDPSRYLALHRHDRRARTVGV